MLGHVKFFNVSSIQYNIKKEKKENSNQRKQMLENLSSHLIFALAGKCLSSLIARLFPTVKYHTLYLYQMKLPLTITLENPHAFLPFFCDIGDHKI